MAGELASGVRDRGRACAIGFPVLAGLPSADKGSMPTKRAVLAELTRNELRTTVDHYELYVDDRRVNTQLVDALARARHASLDEILRSLSLGRLKELCRAFNRDDSGRNGAREEPRSRARGVSIRTHRTRRRRVEHRHEPRVVVA